MNVASAAGSLGYDFETEILLFKNTLAFLHDQDPKLSSVQALDCKPQSHNCIGQSFRLTPPSCGYPPFLFRVIAHRRGGRELGSLRAERKTMIMRESTGDDVGISSKLD